MYFVIEIQKLTDGSWAKMVYDYEDKAHAESKYYNILSYATVAAIPVHGALMINDYGQVFHCDFPKHDGESEERE